LEQRDSRFRAAPLAEPENCVKLLGRVKDIYIDDLMGFDEGKLFDSFFLVLAKQQRTTRQNKPYLSLTLGDKKGQIEGRVWELGDPRIAKDFDRGDMVKVRGSVSRFDDRAQLKVDQLRKALDSEADKKDMLPATSRDVGELWRMLEASIASVTNPRPEAAVKCAAHRCTHRAGFSRGAGRAATASCMAGRAARTR
jgi:3'-5' exoribonuclease